MAYSLHRQRHGEADVGDCKQDANERTRQTNMNRHIFDLMYANATHHPLCPLTCQASPSVQSEIPSRARSLMRNCPGTADRAGKPPRLGSQTPGVVTRKLRVVRNIPTARALPRAEARGENGRAAMSSAT